MKGLRWYLERFLDYPFHPETDHAKYVLNALKDWGQKIFSSLSLGNHVQPGLRIACNDPLILNWPWEAITDNQGEFIAQTCQINRQIMNAASPLPMPENLPRNQISILLITARPKKKDLQFRSTSRPLLELTEPIISRSGFMC